jgi:hypothetical protein
MSVNNLHPSGKKPKRPLTPYNLFYRFKRGRILVSCADGKGDKEMVCKLIAAVPGLEYFSFLELKALGPKDAVLISRDVIRKEMRDNLLPFEGKREHRKTHGAMSFLEMGRMMCDQWKAVDDAIKEIFVELAEEGKCLYRERLRRYKEDIDTMEVCSQTQGSTTGEDTAGKAFATYYTVGKAAGLATAISSDASQASESTNDDEEPTIGSADDEDNGILSLPTTKWLPCSPRPATGSKVNIVSPVSSKPLVNINFEKLFKVDHTETNDGPISDEDDDDDEFCAFIDKNVHLVDTNGIDGFDLSEEAPTGLMDIIAMDESINHLMLPY